MLAVALIRPKSRGDAYRCPLKEEEINLGRRNQE
jgi:hypothetical protein